MKYIIILVVFGYVVYALKTKIIDFDGETAAKKEAEEKEKEEKKRKEEEERKREEAKYKNENARVAGTSYRQEQLKEICGLNPLFSKHKNELIDMEQVDKRIFEYEQKTKEVEIIAEPDNPYDANALKVIIEGLHIGYIKKGSCSHIKNLLKRNPEITATIQGGRYKYISSYCDWDRDKDLYEFNTGDAPIFANLLFRYKIEDKEDV